MAVIRFKSFLFRWGPTILVMLILFLVSSIPMKIYPPSIKPWKLSWGFIIKKGGHLLGYALLALTTLHGLGMRGLRNYMISLAFCLVFALTDEFHQSFIPGRSARWLDIFIDMLGAEIGVWIGKNEKVWILIRNIWK